MLNLTGQLGWPTLYIKMLLVNLNLGQFFETQVNLKTPHVVSYILDTSTGHLK